MRYKPSYSNYACNKENKVLVHWAYDLSPFQCDEEFIDPRHERKLTLVIDFAEDVRKALSMCIYMQFDSEIKINEFGKTILMYD